MKSIKKEKNDYKDQIDQDQEENQESQNQYENDDFIVDDNYQSDYQEGSKHQRTKNYKHSKKKHHMAEEEIDQDDKELIKESRKRLKKIRQNVEYQKQIQQKPIQKVENNYIYQDFQQEYDKNIQNQQSQQHHLIKLENIIGPEQYDQILKQQDKNIIQLDIPQRYQQKIYKLHLIISRPMDQTQLYDQTKWIVEKLRSRHSYENNLKVQKQVQKTLELIRKKYFEPMYIFYFKRYSDDFMIQLSLQEIYQIYGLDEEWVSFRKLKIQLQNSLPNLFDQKDIKQLDNAKQLITLRYIKEYYQFNVSKRMDIDLNRNKLKLPFRSNLVRQIYTSRLEKLANKITVNGSNLHHNMLKKKQIHKPQTLNIHPINYFNSYKVQNIQNHPLLKTPNSILASFCQYLQLSLYKNPSLRGYLTEKYMSKQFFLIRLQVTTYPTPKGENITINSWIYPVKRIIKKPIHTFQSELWVLVQHAQKNQLINVYFHFQWEDQKARQKRQNTRREQKMSTHDQPDKSDQIYFRLKEYYLDHSQSDHVTHWNRLRMQAIQCLLYYHIYPNTINYARKQLFQKSQAYVVNQASKKFKELLNKGPFIVIEDDKTRPAFVVSMVLGNDKKLAIVAVDQHGILKSKKIINYENSKIFLQNKCHPQLIQFIHIEKPDFITIEANCLQARKILNQVRSIQNLKENTWTCLGEQGIPKLIAKNMKYKKKINQQLIILQALSLARLKQNALAQILSLWNQKIQENGCLHLYLHYLQKFVDQKKLKEQLQKMAVIMVNHVGVDLNETIEYQHVRSVLQFVCGFGIKKSLYFYKRVDQLKVSKIYRREEIKQIANIGNIVFQNCSGFLKIVTEAHLVLKQNPYLKRKQKGKKQLFSLLEITRIHQSQYKTANHIAQYTLGSQHTNDPQCDLSLIMKKPNKLDQVEAGVSSSTNQALISFIKQQLRQPFKDPREQYKEIDNKDLFYMLIKQTPQTFRKFQVLSVKIINLITNSQNRQIIVRINQNGILGQIYERDISDNINYNNLKKGQIIKAMIINFPALDQRRHDSNQRKIILKEEQVLDYQNIIKDLKQVHQQIPQEHWKYFKSQPYDYSDISVREQVVNNLFIRKINHPKYRKINLKNAIQQVQKLPIGQFIIRPSSRGQQYLNITWKFWQNVIIHLPVKQQPRGPNNMITRFRIQSVKQPTYYNSYDQIIDHYIKPINKYMQQAGTHPKFINQNLQQIQQKLKKIKQQQTNTIFYRFGCSQLYPQYIILMLIPKQSKIVKQYIKVKQNGLHFHQNVFQQLNEIINYFKVNYQKDQYQKYMRCTRAPLQQRLKRTPGRR